jgi:hypothetical protein
MLCALGGAGGAGNRTCLHHHLYDGTVLANAPIGNGAGRHADLRAIEGMSDALDERRSIAQARIRDAIASLRAGMTLLNATGNCALRIRFDVVGCSVCHVHVHDAVS